jgi:ABC-2 type transport system ATP-binding protein
VIPQEFRFFDKIHPEEAVHYYGVLFGTHPDPDKLLRLVGLTDKAHARFDTLSGGQKQKLGLALALVNDPKVCFLDEPTTGLDPQARRAIWDVIRQLKSEGRTVFLTTHYLEEAELLADQVAIIHHGQIIAHGTPEEIIARHGGPERLTVEGPPSLAQYLNQKLGVSARSGGGRVVIPMRDRGDALKVLTALEASGIPWQRFATEHDTLEDVFVGLVGRMDDGVLKSEEPA